MLSVVVVMVPSHRFAEYVLFCQSRSDVREITATRFFFVPTISVYFAFALDFALQGASSCYFFFCVVLVDSLVPALSNTYEPYPNWTYVK